MGSSQIFLEIDFDMNKTFRTWGTIYLMNQNFSSSSWKWPPHVNDHLSFTFWIIAYERFNCMCLLGVTKYTSLCSADVNPWQVSPDVQTEMCRRQPWLLQIEQIFPFLSWILEVTEILRLVVNGLGQLDELI